MNDELECGSCVFMGDEINKLNTMLTENESLLSVSEEALDMLKGKLSELTWIWRYGQMRSISMFFTKYSGPT